MFPLLIKIFLRKRHWLSIRLFFLTEIFLSVCVFWCLEGPFPGIMSHMGVEEWGLSSKWKPWRPHLSNREGRRRGSQVFPIHKFISYHDYRHWIISKPWANVLFATLFSWPSEIAGRTELRKGFAGTTPVFFIVPRAVGNLLWSFCRHQIS